MKKLLPLLLCCLMLGGCGRDPLSPMAQVAEGVPAPAVEGLPQTERIVTLWFRYGTEPFLAPESREIAVAPAQDEALALLTALLEGPAASSALSNPFPQGTRVLSVTQSGRTMFVTLTKQIMNGFADEPASWRDQPVWAIEVPLRRELAMQAIAATLTENCAVDQVVILVDQGGIVTDSLRLRRDYYTRDGDKALADPLTRDESLLLTPARTAEVILSCWMEQDFARLYRYIARTDPQSGASRPDEAAFIALMAQEARLLRAKAQGGSISADGQSAVFTVSGAWLSNGEERTFDGLVLQLTRENGLWRAGLSQVTGREALP